MQTNEPNDGLSGHEREMTRLREEITRLRELLRKNECNYVNMLCNSIYKQNVKAGWWTVSVIEPLQLATKIALIHSEISEAMEAYRCNKVDEHLPWRPGVAVELADAVIRIFDLAGALAIPLGTIMEEKIKYNTTRGDHKLEVRRCPGGKKF